MCFNFSFHSIILATFAFGTLLSCGGSGGGDKNEIPYILPTGTKITINCGRPSQHWITPLPGGAGAPAPVEIPMTMEQETQFGWGSNTLTLSIISDGIGVVQFYGINNPNLFNYERTSSTSFDLTVTWSGAITDDHYNGNFVARQCELTKANSVYGTVGTWEYRATTAATADGARFSVIRLVGGGTAADTLQYEQYNN